MQTDHVTSTGFLREHGDLIVRADADQRDGPLIFKRATFTIIATDFGGGGHQLVNQHRAGVEAEARGPKRQRESRDTGNAGKYDAADHQQGGHLLEISSVALNTPRGGHSGHRGPVSHGDKQALERDA